MEGSSGLSSTEAESVVQSLKIFSMEEMTEPKWFRQVKYVEQLNVQAHYNVATDSEEFIMEYLVSHNKFIALIHDLILTEAWKSNALPLLKKEALHSGVSLLKPYLIIYHELTILNLFEITFYHKSAVLSSEDGLIELVDYCFRKLHWLNTKYKPTPAARSAKEIMQSGVEEQIQEKIETVDFSIAIIVLSLVRYISDNVSELPLSVLNRLLVNNDVILSLVQLLLSRPWIKKEGNKAFVYEDNRWDQMKPGELNQRLPKVAAQVWLSVYNFLLDVEARKKYKYNNTNKATILKLKNLITEVLVDQIPILGDLQKFLEQLAISEPPTTDSIFLIEQVPEMRENILKQDWKKIEQIHKKHLFESNQDAKDEISKLVDVFKSSNLDVLMEKPKCANCGAVGTKRCSRCKNEWYCGRECQVKFWSKHKPICDVISSSSK